MASFGCCNGCGKKHGLFTKESDCMNCKLIFCMKCVSQTVDVQLEGKSVKHRVCTRCYKLLTGKLKEPEKRDISPPANFLRNLEATKAKLHSQQVSHCNKTSPAVKSDKKVKSQLKPQYRTLSTEEMEIAERLEKLKQDRKEMELGPQPLPPPIQDVEQRLAKLKGTPTPAEMAPHSTQVHRMQQPSQPSSQLETDRLLEEICAEVEIDDRFDSSKVSKTPTGGRDVIGGWQESPDVKSQQSDDIESLIAQTAKELEMDAEKAIQELKQDKDIVARLEEIKKSRRALAGNSSADAPSSETNDDNAEALGGVSADKEDEAAEIKLIIQQALEERKLDEDLEKEGGFRPASSDTKEAMAHSRQQETDDDVDELPWCSICNEDARLRCLDCDNDLYCLSCYKTAHLDFYDENHRTVAYKKPQNCDDS